MVFQIPSARKERIWLNVVEGIWFAVTGIKMMMMSFSMVEDTVLVGTAAFLVGFIRRVAGVGLMTASARMEDTELPLPSDVKGWGCHTQSVGSLK
jgi:cytochrome b subunit of formate dehydrogenase